MSFQLDKRPDVGSNNLLSSPNPRHIVTTQMMAGRGYEEIPMGPMPGDPQDHGMLYATRLVNTYLILRVLVIDVNLPVKKLHNTSKSGLLFSLYSKMVEEDDNKRAERQQKDAEGIILFVSPHSYLLTPEQVDLHDL